LKGSGHCPWMKCQSFMCGVAHAHSHIQMMSGHKIKFGLAPSVFRKAASAGLKHMVPQENCHETAHGTWTEVIQTQAY